MRWFRQHLRWFAAVVTMVVCVEVVAADVVAADPPPADVSAADEAPLAPSGDPDGPPPDELDPLPVADPAEPVVDEAQATSVVPGSGSLATVSGVDPGEVVPVEELVDRRGASQDVFENADGSFTLNLYSEPKYFDAGGGDWQEIDNSLVADEGRPGWVRNAANGWTVEFGPISPDAATSVELTSAAGSVGFVPMLDAGSDATITPEVDGESVVYADVWPGVDLRYTVWGGGVDEEIVIGEDPGDGDFGFSLPEVALEPVTTSDVAEVTASPGDVASGDPVGFEVAGTDLVVGAPETSNADGEPVDGEADTAAAVEPTADGSELVVSVDADWLGGLDADEFPVVIDPSITIGPNAFANFKSDGTVDTVSSQRTGNVRDPGDNYWRGLVGYPYEQIWQNNPPGTAVASATLNLTLDAGSTTARNVEVHEATGLSYSAVGQKYTEATFPAGPLGTSGTIDVTNPIASWVHLQQSGKGFFLTGEETPGTFTYKRYATTLTIIYDRPPAAPTAVAPADGATVATSTPTLQVNPATDPDGDPVSYLFRVASNADGSGGFVHSPVVSSPQWTVPPGSLRNGVTYYWQAYGFDGQLVGSPSALRALRVDQRLGSGGPSPTESVGPLGVNLATGNVSLSTGTPSLPALGGSAGLTFSYDSLSDTTTGLVGSYYSDLNNNGVIESGEPRWLSRVDPGVDFDWGAGAPESLPGDGWYAKWTGQLRVPADGAWRIGARAAGRVRVTVGSTLVLDAWAEGKAPAGPVYGANPQSLTAGTAVSITVEYGENSGNAAVELWMQNTSDPSDPGVIVPASWLSTGDRPLPQGWALSADLDGELTWVRARKNNASITLYDSDGGTAEFKRQGSGAAAGYKTPEGYNDIVSVNPTGQVVVAGEDGTTYTFGSDGTLAAAVSGLDDRQPAALGYTWAPITSGGPVRLTTITDPVSGRQITMTYQGGSGTCPTSTGFDTTPPSGMLCRIDYWDGSHTEIWYLNQRLARIVDPGVEVTDFGYDASGRLTSLRDPLTMDAIAAGVVPNDNTTRYEVDYGTDGRASGMRPPAANTYRPTTHVNYGGSGQTTVNVDGRQEPNGFTRKVTWDGAGRQLTEVDATNITTSTDVWTASDLVSYSTDAAGLRSSTIYDSAGRETRSWGPAPATCFTNDTPTGACQVPGTQSFYDEGIQGLAASYWNNQDLQGAPLVHDTGVGDATGALSHDWTTSAPTGLGVTDHWSARYSGEILLPQSANYDFLITSDDGARLWIDDVPVIDGWTNGSAFRFGTVTIANPTAGTRHRIRVEYYDYTGSASISLFYRIAPSGSWAAVPGANLVPGYGLQTRQIDEDGKTTTTTYGSVTGSGVGPEHGLATATVTDPSGLNLVEQTAYENPGSGYLRQTSHTLPAGNQTTTTYYGATETRDNPCTAPSDPVSQAGMLNTTTSPDPDGNGPETAHVEEAVYDISGRIVATRVGSEPWTCTIYDARGRVAQVDYPAFGSQPARVVTSTYAVSNNPLWTKVSDPAGDVQTVIDLQGRVVVYSDVWGKATFTGYDAAGEVANASSPYGNVTYLYDAAGRLTQTGLDSQIIANVTYDTAGRLSQIIYPANDGNSANGVEGGNGTRSAPISYDTYGRLASLRWETTAGALITSDSVARNLGGDIIDQQVDGNDPNPSGNNYTYDNASRLTDAYVPGGRYQYAYVPSGGCGTLPTAGKNTNRTSMTVTPTGGSATTTSYCYDNADRITSSTDSAVSTVAYDAHGNTTSIFGETHTYDIADRHMTTTRAGATVSYLRDATDRIVERKLNGTTVARYSSSGNGDTPDATLDAVGNTLERTLSLPGGVLWTNRAGSSPKSWSYPNLHGDFVATADQAGVKQGQTTNYDPYGNLISGTLLDNATGNFDYGWLGQHQRPLEHEPSFEPIIEMGARQYSARLGRFLEVDPIEGGCANSYTYVSGDPIQAFDLNGMKSWCQRTRERIYRIMNEIRNRIHEIRADVHHLPMHGRMSIESHRAHVRSMQRRQRRRLRDYTSRGCGPPPSGAWSWATAHVPYPRRHGHHHSSSHAHSHSHYHTHSYTEYWVYGGAAMLLLGGGAPSLRF
jgi:RHS repeat-associated protein